MSFRQMVLVTHRWIGLGSSIVLAIVGTSGALLVTPGLPLRKYAGPIHQHLALNQVGLGTLGWWIVVIATVLAVVLELGGLFLWWKRKLLKIRIARGWRQGLTDLHHLAGIVVFPIMFILALSGVGMAAVTPKAHPQLRRVVFDLHTAKNFPMSAKLLYALATTGFLVQGVTGVVMWWSPKASARSAGMPLTETDRYGR